MSIFFWHNSMAPWLLFLLLSMALNGADTFAKGQNEGVQIPTEGDVARAEAYFRKGHAALDKRNGYLAERLYRKAIEFNSSESRYHRQLALLLTTMSRGQEAEREACLAVVSNSEDWRSKLVLANIYQLEGRVIEEMQLYKQVIDLLPNDQSELKEKLSLFVFKEQIAQRQALEKARQKQKLEEAPFRNQY